MVKVHARQFHSPGGATVDTPSSENVNQVTFAQKQSEGRYPRQVNRFRYVVAASKRHRHASSNSKKIAKSKISKGKSRVRSVTDESTDE